MTEDIHATLELIHALAREYDALSKALGRQLLFEDNVNQPGVERQFGKSHKNVSFYRDFEWRVAKGEIDLPKAVKALALIVRRVDYFGVMIKNLLGSLSQNQKLTINRRPVDFAALLEEIVDLFDYSAAEKAVDIKLRVLDHPILRVDRQLVYRMLVNLLDNAIKYSYSSANTSDRRYILIDCHRYSMHGDFLIEMKSYGVGIEPDEIKTGAIFEYGRRGKLASERGRRGTGVGLAEAKRIAEAHNGRIKIESNKLEGDTFLTSVQVILPGGGGRERHGKA